MVMVDQGAGDGGKSIVRWTRSDIDPKLGGIEAGYLGKTTYNGPCPPSGDDPHHYVFAVYALKGPSRSRRRRFTRRRDRRDREACRGAGNSRGDLRPRAGAAVSKGPQWGRQGSNLRRLSRRFYRPLPLATRALPRTVADMLETAPTGPTASSRSRWASGSCWSFLSVLFSIWRMRSRVTPNAWPTSSSVLRPPAREAVAHLDHLALALGQRVQRPPHVLALHDHGRGLERRLGASRPRRSRRARSPRPRRSASRARSAAARCAARRAPRAACSAARARSPPASARGRASAPAGARRARRC